MCAPRKLGLIEKVSLCRVPLCAGANARVSFETDEGNFVVETHHEWAPRAAAKFQAMVRDHFFTEMRFHKIEEVRKTCRRRCRRRLRCALCIASLHGSFATARRKAFPCVDSWHRGMSCRPP
eukprot:SAG31_NODE_19569_length_598_cov_1.172345_1_plen_121_part_01